MEISFKRFGFCCVWYQIPYQNKMPSSCKVILYKSTYRCTFPRAKVGDWCWKRGRLGQKEGDFWGIIACETFSTRI